MKLRILLVIATIAIAAAGCSSTATFQTGEDAEVTHDGLTKLDKTIMDAVWARTDLDLTGINKIMLLGAGVEYRPVDGPYSGKKGIGSTGRSSNTSEFQLHPDTKALFEEEITGAFVEELGLSEVFEVVEEPGPDVLLVRGGLLDVVSRVPPESVGRSRVFLDSVGEATLVLEIRDSVSYTVLVRAVDRRAMAGMTAFESSSPRNRAEVRRLGKRWGQMLRDGLENVIADGLVTE